MPLASYSHEWKTMPQELLPIAATRPPDGHPLVMVKILAADFRFRAQGIEVEGFNDIGVDLQYSREDSARRFHDSPIHIPPYWIDKYPVTDGQFEKFFDAMHYDPQDDFNFLRDWQNGNFPRGWDNKPVTWISVEGARTYATWRQALTA